MRRVRYVLTALLGVLAAGRAQQISVAAAGSPQSLSGAIIVRITLANTSNTPIRIIETNSDKEYHLTALNDSGQAVPLTPYGKEMSDPQGPLDRNFALVLQPKETAQMQLDLHKFFDCNGPGRYTVSVRRKIYKTDSRSGTEIVSNELALELKR